MSLSRTLFLTLSLAATSCSALRRENRDIDDDKSNFSTDVMNGYWLLSKVKFSRDGRNIEDIRTRANTIVIAVSNGSGNAFDVSTLKFICNSDQPVAIRRNIYFEFQSDSECRNKSWLAQKVDGETLILRDINWNEANFPSEVDLEFTKSSPKDTAAIIYRVVKPEEVKGSLFYDLQRYKTEINQ